jgi:hypothetical protein
MYGIDLQLFIERPIPCIKWIIRCLVIRIQYIWWVKTYPCRYKIRLKIHMYLELFHLYLLRWQAIIDDKIKNLFFKDQE